MPQAVLVVPLKSQLGPGLGEPRLSRTWAPRPASLRLECLVPRHLPSLSGASSRPGSLLAGGASVWSSRGREDRQVTPPTCVSAEMLRL